MDWGPEAGVHAEADSGVLPGSVTQPEPSEDNVTALGWSAAIPLEQSLADIVDYYRDSREGRV
ncbi:hypothetical protein D3C85_1852850 [compost metagenome]